MLGQGISPRARMQESIYIYMIQTREVRRKNTISSEEVDVPVSNVNCLFPEKSLA